VIVDLCAPMTHPPCFTFIPMENLVLTYARFLGTLIFHKMGPYCWSNGLKFDIQNMQKWVMRNINSRKVNAAGTGLLAWTARIPSSRETVSP
jgi:hypothetical protein